MKENPKPGPRSLSEQTGEETRTIKLTLTKSQHDFLMSRPVSASHYCRSVIDNVMKYRAFCRAGIAPSCKDFFNWYREELSRQYKAKDAAEIDEVLIWLDMLRVFMINLGCD